MEAGSLLVITQPMGESRYCQGIIGVFRPIELRICYPLPIIILMKLQLYRLIATVPW